MHPTYATLRLHSFATMLDVYTSVAALPDVLIFWIRCRSIRSCRCCRRERSRRASGYGSASLCLISRAAMTLPLLLLFDRWVSAGLQSDIKDTPPNPSKPPSDPQKQARRKVCRRPHDNSLQKPRRSTACNLNPFFTTRCGCFLFIRSIRKFQSVSI
eukprot:scaffold213956_cov20-Prasinocladus_malaysianus.AAC.1